MDYGNALWGTQFVILLAFGLTANKNRRKFREMTAWQEKTD
jgi:hypothetical protein